MRQALLCVGQQLFRQVRGRPVVSHVPQGGGTVCGFLARWRVADDPTGIKETDGFNRTIPIRSLSNLLKHR